MSEVVSHTDLISLQFRDELRPMPQAKDLDHLSELIEARVKPGLAELCSKSDLSTAEYAGYAFATYIFPMDRLEFRFPEAAQEMRKAITGVGLKVGDILPRNPQDFWLSESDCFDNRAISHRYPRLFREGVYPQSDIEGVSKGYGSGAYVLGPVIRHYVDGLGDRDQYNQPDFMDFSTRWSVFVRESVILPGLKDTYPGIAEGYAIPVGTPHEYLARRFGLLAIDNTYEEWYEGLRRHENTPSDKTYTG